MTTAAFRDTKFRPESLAKIEKINEIIANYQAQGLRLTLRQLYYAGMPRLWPNSDRSYKNLGNLVSAGRLAGLIDWDAIEDRGRVPRRHAQFDSISDLMDAAFRSYRLPRWAGQANYVELWVEKDALAGVLSPLADEFHVTLVVNKGYSSQSAMFAASRRFIDEGDADTARGMVLLYLGDHDPSGEDMVRDIEARMNMFGVEGIDVRKVALTIEQVRQHALPPMPVKGTDSRAAAYLEEHGGAWEVDALPPNVLQGLIRSALEDVVDQDLVDRIKAIEESHKAELRKVVAKLMRRKT